MATVVAVALRRRLHPRGHLRVRYDYAHFSYGWPAPFGEYGLSLRKSQFFQATEMSFRFTSAAAAIGDVFLAVALVAATGMAVSRFVRRLYGRPQFTVADMLAVTTAVAMVLGLLRLDGMVEVQDGYMPLRRCTQFDRAMVLLAVGCFTALTVSTRWPGSVPPRAAGRRKQPTASRPPTGSRHRQFRQILLLVAVSPHLDAPRKDDRMMQRWVRHCAGG